MTSPSMDEEWVDSVLVVLDKLERVREHLRAAKECA